METLKSLVATLTTVLIFISAVELIAPKNKIKKYVSFVLGLILIIVILNPIIKFISNGERSIQAGIESYASVFSKNENRINSDSDSLLENSSDNNSSRKSAFIKNFNRNCDSMLKNKFPELTFKSNVDCDVDFVNININIKKLRIGIKDKSIRKIEPIRINDDKQQGDENLNNQYGDIITYASSELKIPKEKIEVYRLDE